jgi:hypothetical protein
LIEQDVIPVLTNAHRRDTDASRAGYLRFGNTLLVVAVCATVSKEDQMANHMLTVMRIQLRQAHADTVEDLGSSRCSKCRDLGPGPGTIDAYSTREDDLSSIIKGHYSQGVPIVKIVGNLTRCLFNVLQPRASHRGTAINDEAQIKWKTTSLKVSRWFYLYQGVEHLFPVGRL